ncbi:uncharacterized protein LAESUDRAFT_758557 [Laetiporus sulphureus 93-53]|uniref:Glycopeptide n=1 Tax=Laetiporus sulphureus 93-53 TaxID=1314785 RepID=A0A165EQJ9_9APHY|nr:uncharacterized protein LAESUDRAFT_758557 [Laetiporus sulphureus 93-53]KZT07556.1 hypothetical protein LAESUDRAFT_758557 [Laetiporus sulphureus 93-53]
MFSKFTASLVAVAIALVHVNAETHTVTFTNDCGGSGYPILRAQDGTILSTGGAYTIDGPLIGAIAYLQTGGCGDNGEYCTLIETTLENGASSTDISLIPPHEFSVTSGFGYYDGCDGAGADCTYADCPTAFHSSGQTGVQVACTADNENLAITFCD